MSGPYCIELVGRELIKGQQMSGVQRWHARETGDEAIAGALIDAASPRIWEGLVKQNVRVEELGGGVWAGEVQYGERERGEPNTVEWSFEIGGGGSVHVDHSLQTVGKYAKAGTPPDFKGLIHVRNDGNGLAVDGMDIDVTSFAWSETHHIPYAILTPAYISTLYLIRGKVNEHPWRIFDKGEVRLKSISGSARGQWTVPLTFNFEASHNITGLKVGDITGIAKRGWEYLWVFAEEVEDQTAHVKVKQPQAVYVEQIYEYADFRLLGLPDPWH